MQKKSLSTSSRLHWPITWLPLPSSVVLICSISLLLIAIASNIQAVKAAEYTARYQPEFGNVKLETYLKNPRLFNLQLNCLLYDGPCDIVGRFLKPRIAKALLGECYLCTPNQEQEIQKLLTFVQEKRPDLYRIAIRKYLQYQGIQVSPEPATQNSQLHDQQENETGAESINTNNRS